MSKWGLPLFRPQTHSVLLARPENEISLRCCRWRMPFHKLVTTRRISGKRVCLVMRTGDALRINVFSTLCDFFYYFFKFTHLTLLPTSASARRVLQCHSPQTQIFKFISLCVRLRRLSSYSLRLWLHFFQIFHGARWKALCVRSTFVASDIGRVANNARSNRRVGITSWCAKIYYTKVNNWKRTEEDVFVRDCIGATENDSSMCGKCESIG